MDLRKPANIQANMLFRIHSQNSFVLKIVFLFTALLILTACNKGKVDSMGKTDELLAAAKSGDHARLQKLLDSGVPANAQIGGHKTALMIAAAFGHTEAATVLLANGADPNAASKGEKPGRTPLMAAATFGHLELTRLLLKHGAKPNDQDYQGSTSLLLAAARGHADVLSELIANGGNVELSNMLGVTPLMVSGNNEVARLLIQNEAKINGRSVRGDTALMAAVDRRNLDLAKYLVSEGSNLEERNELGLSALDIAEKRQYSEFYTLLQ